MVVAIVLVGAVKEVEVETLTCLRASIYRREIVLGLSGVKIRKFQPKGRMAFVDSMNLGVVGADEVGVTGFGI